MDIGGFRDMHRHRKCVQLLQGYTDLHGYELPDAPGQPTLAEAGLAGEVYAGAMESAYVSYRQLLSFRRTPESASPNPDAAYLLPLGTRCRAMFKMDFAEALYISELRSTVAGHYQLSPRGVGDVQGRGEAASVAGAVLPHQRCE